MLAYALALLLLLQPAAPAQELRIEVFKARRELVLYSGKKPLKTYRVGLGLKPVGRKVRQGDRATPEGSYVVCRKNPASAYYLGLDLSERRRRRARSRGGSHLSRAGPAYP